MPKVPLSTNISIYNMLTMRPFTIVRTTTFDTTDGYNAVQEIEEIQSSGDVQSFNGLIVDQKTQYAIQGEKIVIHTKDFITPGYVKNDGTIIIRYDGDLIVWNNKKYKVIEVSDWSDYDIGFYEVIAVVQTFNARGI